MAHAVMELLRAASSFEASTIIRTGATLGAVAIITDVTATMSKRFLQQRALARLIFSPKAMYATASNFLARPDALALLQRTLTKNTDSCAVIVAQASGGVTSLLKTLAAQSSGMVYLSLAGVVSLSQLATALAHCCGLTYSIRLPAWLLAVQRVVSGESHVDPVFGAGDDTDGAGPWSEVTTLFETAVSCDKKAVLIFDHVNELNGAATNALMTWVASLLTSGTANACIVCDRPFSLVNTPVAPRMSHIVLPEPSFAALKTYVRSRCPGLTNDEANFVLCELTGPSLGMLEFIVEKLRDTNNSVAAARRGILMRIATLSRPWHLVSVQRVEDEALDAQRKVLFTIAATLLAKSPRTLDEGVTQLADDEAERRWHGQGTMCFAETFALVRYAVYRDLVETPKSAMSLPIWTSFDLVRFAWPASRYLFEFTMGGLGSPRWEESMRAVAEL